MLAPRSLSRSLLAPSLLLALAPLAASQDAGARGRELFLKNCASCHGATGDGKGTAELDRPARSFMDGGFSFGNTPEALFRTISVGIPGTPMAGFDASLSEEERRIVAAYVVTLGPPIEEVKEEDMILAVHDRPLVVRGKLPSLGEGLPEHPRGLLVGDPSGITFEYTVDDVRLLALRQGGFVKRTDWTGRGGTALEPLGKVVHLMAGGKPEATFSIAGGATPLEAKLSGTRVDGDSVNVGYHLVLGGRELAHVSETPVVQALPFGTGFVRNFQMTGGTERVHLTLADPTQGKSVVFTDKTSGRDQFGNPIEPWCIRKESDGTHVFQHLALGATRWSRKDGVLIVDLDPGQKTWVEIATVPLGAWNRDVEKQIRTWSEGK